MKMIEVCRCTIYRLVNLSNIDSHTFYGAALTHTLTQDLLINKKNPGKKIQIATLRVLCVCTMKHSI
jgi:hypothetical protein